MALASTLLRATVGGVCAGVGAGVGTVVIGSLTVLLRSGGGDGSRVAAASDGLSSSRDRLALRAANESISSCGGGSRLCAGHGCMQPAARSGVATPVTNFVDETTFCMHFAGDTRRALRMTQVRPLRDCSQIENPVKLLK